MEMREYSTKGPKYAWYLLNILLNNTEMPEEYSGLYKYFTILADLRSYKLAFHLILWFLQTYFNCLPTEKHLAELPPWVAGWPSISSRKHTWQHWVHYSTRFASHIVFYFYSYTFSSYAIRKQLKFAPKEVSLKMAIWASTFNLNYLCFSL